MVSRTTRKWSDLTHPKKLEHIRQLVDGAIEEAIQSDGISSLEDFKEWVESYSQEQSQHPITMELVKVDGELRGFRFYLSEDPSQRTSGKYLAQYLECENKYTPTKLRQILGIDFVVESKQDFQSDLASRSRVASGSENDFESDLTTPTTQPQRHPKKTKSVEAKVDQDEDWDMIAPPTQSNSSNRSSRQPKKIKSQKSASENPRLAPLDEEWQDDDMALGDSIDDPFDAAMDDDWDLLDADSLNAAPLAQPPEAATPSAQIDVDDAIDPLEPLETPAPGRASGYSPPRRELEEATDLVARATTTGQDLNGINAAGLFGQTLALGTAVAQDVVNSIRLQQIEQQLNTTYDRLKSLADRSTAVKTQQVINQLDATGDRVADLTARVENLEQEQSPSSQMSMPPAAAAEPLPVLDVKPTSDSGPNLVDSNIAPIQIPQSEDSQVADQFAIRASQIGDRVNQLCDDLNTGHQPLREIEFDPSDRFSKRLDKIEAYLKQINQRLDTLEQRIEQLEEQFEQHAPIDGSYPAINTSSPLQSDEKVWLANQSWDVTCGERILKFAGAVNKAEGGNSDASGVFSLVADRQAFIDREDQITQVTVEDEQGTVLYAATNENLKWSIHVSKLQSDCDKRLISALPQTCQDYERRQMAQAFVTKLESQYPDAFTSKDSSFVLSVAQQSGISNHTFEVKEVDGRKVLRGSDETDKTLLAATQSGKDWEIEGCELSADTMNAVLQQQNTPRSHSHPESSQQSLSKQPVVADRNQRRQHEQSEL